jgi:hypothetical protein
MIAQQALIIVNIGVINISIKVIDFASQELNIIHTPLERKL